MKLALLLALICLRFAKGHLDGLEQLVRCATSASASRYLGYGCWCSSAKSRAPVDQIDLCCYFEHNCKQMIQRLGCKQRESQTVYHAQCSGNGTITCSVRNNTPCAYALCECQRFFAICIAQHPYPARKPLCR